MSTEKQPWQTPFDRGMKCGTCKYWAPTGTNGYHECAAIPPDDKADFVLAKAKGTLLTKSDFSCSYWEKL